MSEDMEELVEEEEEEEEEQEEEEEEEEESTTQRSSTRGSQWKAGEDRAFVKEVLAVKPFNCTVQLNSLHHRKEVRVWSMWAVTAVGTQVKGGSTS